MEARGDTVVFTFGRLNPPTIGHGKVFDAIAKQQSKNSGSKMHIFVSHSQDAKKNPLSYNKKVAYIRKMFPKYAKNVVTSKARTIFEVAVALHNKGYKSIVMVVGSDRVAEFEKLLNEYNGVEGRHGYYGFDNIEVVSAGERDPDAEGAAGMSASKMRAAAIDGDFESFKKGLPSSFKDDKKLYQDVRKEMGIREQRDMGQMDVYEEMRDNYLTGKIWNVGDIIKANGNTGEIVRKGTNYVSYVTEDGKVHKAWLHDIQEKADRDYKKEYDNYHSDPKQIKRRSSRNKARRAMGDKAVKGMDVGHKDNNPLNNDPKNLRNEDPSKNRREPRLREDSAVKVVKDRIKQRKELERGEAQRQKDEDDRDLDAARLRDVRARNVKKEEATLDEMVWYAKVKAKINQMTHPKGYKEMLKNYAEKMKKPNNKTASSIAADIAREYDVSARGFVQYINKMVQKGILPKELEAEYQIESFKDFVSQINEVKQDSDIKDREGTQPAKYHSGLSPATKKKRDAHFKAKKAGPAPGDADAKTKPSKHTQKFKQMYGEALPKDADMGDYIDDFQKSDAPQFKGKSKEKRKNMAIAAYLDKQDEEYQLDEKIAALVKKAEKSGMPYGVLKKVYDRGMAAYKTGHRPGTSPQQWALARVNSFTTKSSGTWGGADKDLAKQVRSESFDNDLDESLWANIHKKRQRIKGGSGEKMRKKGERGAPTPAQMKRAKGEEAELNEWGEIEEAAEYQGKKVTLNKPFYTPDGPKKSAVYVKNEKGNVVKVTFGDPNMEIKRDNPARRKSFRARHNCDNPGPKTKARYWSCKAW